MKLLKMAKNPHWGLAVNFVYAVGNCVIGFLTHSWWFITVGAYYTVLATTRFSVLQIRRKSGANPDTELFARKITGILLVALSICIIGVNILSALKERGTVFHEIIMITIATYTFTKITLAIIGTAKAKRTASPVTKTLRDISLADACVSIYTMQRSMLVSFPGMQAADILILNIFTGTAVWITVLLLGINLTGGKQVTMAKSKITETVTDGYKKIEQGVVDGYKKIEQGVVDGYKKIEQGVTRGYAKIEDKFVEAYLAKDGETVEEAKTRLKKENE